MVRCNVCGWLGGYKKYVRHEISTVVTIHVFLVYSGTPDERRP
jgi:hypothetical protein